MADEDEQGSRLAVIAGAVMAGLLGGALLMIALDVIRTARKPPCGCQDAEPAGVPDA